MKSWIGAMVVLAACGTEGTIGAGGGSDASASASDASPSAPDAAAGAADARTSGGDAGAPDATPIDAAPLGPLTVLDDPLDGSSLGALEGGELVAGGGWRAGARIVYDLGAPIEHGRFSIRVREFDPGLQSVAQKHHMLSMWEGEDANHHQADANGDAWWNVRVGLGYGSGFKFLSTPEGFESRQEKRLIADAVWDPDSVYTLEVVWDATTVTFLLDGEVLHTQTHGRPLALRYVWIGADDTYPIMPGPIYSDLEVVDLSP
jgi:hypothetical protein